MTSLNESVILFLLSDTLRFTQVHLLIGISHLLISESQKLVLLTEKLPRIFCCSSINSSPWCCCLLPISTPTLLQLDWKSKAANGRKEQLVSLSLSDKFLWQLRCGAEVELLWVTEAGIWLRQSLATHLTVCACHGVFVSFKLECWFHCL